MLFWLIAVTVALAGLLLFFSGGTTGLEAIPNSATALGVVALLLLLYLLASRSAGSSEHGLRRLAVPALLVTALAAVASLALSNPDIARVLEANDGPPTARATGVGDAFKSVRIRRNGQGQFLARGDINGSPADFLVDTGASAIVLRASDAEKAGIAVEGLNFAVPVSTANGEIKAAAVRLRALSIGPIRIEGAEALVATPGTLNESLLGMSFLTRLRSYEIEGNYITLRE